MENTDAQTTKTREDVAASREAGNPFEEPFQYWHQTWLDNLGPILQEGLIAGDFAKRVGKTNKEYKPNYGEGMVPLTKKFVSLAHATPDLITSHTIGILVDPEKTIVIDPREAFPKAGSQAFKTDLFNEVIVRDRIAPRQLSGLVIGARREMIHDGNYSYPSGEPLKLEDVLTVLESIDPKYALPIYFKGELVWPK